MRMLAGGVGLLSLLIGVAIVAIIWTRNTKSVVDASKTMRPLVQQLSGHGADGMKVTDSITYNPVMAGSTLRGLTVATIVAGGPMEAYYGLRSGDLITQINGGPLNMYGDDPDMAKAMMVEAFEKQEPLTVQRGGTQMVLPAAAAAAPPAPGAAASTPPTSTASTPPAPRSPVGNHVQNQLDQLRQQLHQQGQ